MSTKAVLTFKSPQTGIIGVSVVGGSFGTYMKWAGIDVVLIRGVAPKPSYMYIAEDTVEIRDAAKLWGRGAIESEDILKKELGSSASVLTIGPAGERLVRFSSINHDLGRQAGRTGGGAVLGSKNLKAIAVKASRGELGYYDEEGLVKLVMEIHKKIKSNPALRGYADQGTLDLDSPNTLGFFPTRYWRKVRMEGYESLRYEHLKGRVRKGTCIGCPIACHRIVDVETPKHERVQVELDYEGIYAIAGLSELRDLDAVSYIYRLVDDYGMDVISAGNVVAFAIEAYRAGKLQIGRRLDYGDPSSVMWLLEVIARREGVGDVLAEGVARAAEKLGLTDIAVHVKGLEPAGYDPRTLKGMVLSYAVSYRGACHLRLMGYHADLRGLGGGRFSTSRDKVEVLVDLEERGVMYDSLPLCKFGRYIYDWNLMKDLLNLATGLNLSVSELKAASRRIINLVRVVNVGFGVSRDSDQLPGRFLREPVEYEGRQYVVTPEEVNSMLNTYYELRGWSANGLPKLGTLKDLGLIEIIESSAFREVLEVLKE